MCVYVCNGEKTSGTSSSLEESILLAFPPSCANKPAAKSGAEALSAFVRPVKKRSFSLAMQSSKRQGRTCLMAIDCF